MASDPVEAVVSTDAGGQEEAIEQDVDGVLTTPAWDHNVVDSTYEHKVVSGSEYEILLSNTVSTIDGTVYTYSKHGSYTGGMTARSGGTTGAPSYVLKVDTVTDRQGNVTTYTYTTSSPATFVQPGTSGSPNYGVGQVSSTSQSGGNADSYSVTYTYEDTGNRRTVAYATPDGTSSWGYGDYIRVGDPTSPTPAFQTLVKLSSGVGTAEEIHYMYDSAGRLMHSAFAQSKQTRSGAPSSYPFYTSSYPAETRARASYDYDPLGHILGVSHWWDAMNTGHTAYISSAIIKNDCSYDAIKGLKAANAYFEGTSGSWPTSANRVETFTYDSQLDFLTQESDSMTGGVVTQSWSYDSAGNRSNSSYSYDLLNRMTGSPGTAYINNILGNRMSQTASGNTITYTWDLLNRMTSRSGATASTTGIYEYRIDGMRTWKRIGTSVSGYSYELTRHDGQMPFEQEVIGSGVTATRNVLGVRGVDAEEIVTGSISGSSRSLGTATISYPIYDVHGNRITTLTRSGASWTCASLRYYDAWGNVLSGAASGGSPMRYCASLGHLQDDESGLVYMRARYYEPTTGRFVSEDPSGDGPNLYIYCANNPANYSDETGKAPSGQELIRQLLALVMAAGGLLAIYTIVALATSEVMDLKTAKTVAKYAIFAYSQSLNACNGHWGIEAGASFLEFAVLSDLVEKVFDAYAVGKNADRECAVLFGLMLAYGLLLIKEIADDYRQNGAPFYS